MLDLFLAIHVAPLLLVPLLLLAGLGALGLIAAAAFLIAEKFEERRVFKDQFDFASSPHDGAAVPDFVNEVVLRSLATHHELDVVPAQIQETKGGKFQGKVPNGVLSAERGHETTVTSEPHDDLGELVRRMVRHLHEMGELNQSIDLIWIEDIMLESVPDFGEPNRAREAFEIWFGERYPAGFDGVTPTQLASELARLGEQLPQGKICDRLKSAFQAVDEHSPEAVLFLEGEWAVSNDGVGTILLSKNNLRLESPSSEGRHIRSIPMPEGATITMGLPESDLTSHGKTRMVGVSRPIRAKALATLKQYDPDTGCFELVPIAVYQRVGNK